MNMSYVGHVHYISDTTEILAMHGSLEFRKEEAVAYLTLNDPDTRNALSGEAMFSAFEESVSRINRDFSVRVVILTGYGTTFCSGGNLTEMRDKKGMFSGTAQEITNQYRMGIQRVPRALWQLDVPLIGAINGPAVGAGCDLACVCDIRLASEKARFAESYVKLGIVPGFGGAWLLARAVGYSRAAKMAFTGEPLEAHTALAAGLVSKVVLHKNLMAEATTLAAAIAENPPQALRWTKRLLREAQSSTLEMILELSAAYQGMAHHTADHEEAIAAMVAKRSPKSPRP
jgi:enoyl-CoA hydratase/carnithine racemase